MKNIFLVGNPNVGKTALLNSLSNSNFRVGNWAGVTVSRQEAWIQLGKESIHFLDLPGIYSLSPCSADEGVSVKELFTSECDLLINVIDINNIHQNLMLTAELTELGIPMIGVLNFYDEFSKSQTIDIRALEDELGIPIIPVSARTGLGIDELKTLLGSFDHYQKWAPSKLIITESKYECLKDIFPQVTERYPLARIPDYINPLFVLAQITVSNYIILDKFRITETEVREQMKSAINNNHDVPNFLHDIIEKKEYLSSIAPVKMIEGKKSKMEQSHFWDHFFLHPILGYVAFLGIMFALFSMVFNVANPWIDFIDWFVGVKITSYASMMLEGTLPEIQSFIIDGLIGGVGSILTFVPLIFVLYIFLAFLEESGYLARVAILLEYPMSKIGLSGKSFFPMMLGFGCNVPSIYGARVLETPELRRLTAILAPLMSCGARLTVFALFVSAFFQKQGGIILFSMYLIGIITAIVLALILSRFAHYKSKSSCFLMVLPPYRFPDIKVVGRIAWSHAHSYIKNAGGVILGMLMVIWALSYFPNQGDISKSYLAKAGNVIQPIFEPLGFGDRWEPVVAIVPSLVAKEAVVGFLGQVLESEEELSGDTQETKSLTLTSEIVEIVSMFGDTVKASVLGLVTWNFFDHFSSPSDADLEDEGGSGIISRLRNIWSGKDAPYRAYSFMLFILLTLPCVASVGALKQELDKQSFWLCMMIYLVIPYVISLVFFQTARLFF